MTNRDRADQLFSEALEIAGEMRDVVSRGRWNLAARRAQEVVELAAKALLNEMGLEYPRTHDPAPLLAEAVKERGLEADPEFLTWLRRLSGRLAEIRAPAFYHEIEVSEQEARASVDGAERLLAFGQEFMKRLRGTA